MRTTGWRAFGTITRSSPVRLRGERLGPATRAARRRHGVGPHDPRRERGEERRSRAGRSHRPPPVAAQGVGRRLVHVPPERRQGRQEAREQEEREGPQVGQHRSRGRRLRAERQLHRSRARQRSRAHGAAAPHESRRRLPADVRRRPVADQQLAVEPDDVGCADRRPAYDGRRRGGLRSQPEHALPGARRSLRPDPGGRLDGEVEERRRRLGPDDRARRRGLRARREGRHQHQQRHRPRGHQQRPLPLGGRRANVRRRSHLRRPLGLEHRADERGLARIGAALSRGQRRPAVRAGDDALSVHRSRRDLGADHERGQRVRPQRPDHPRRGRARRQRGLRLLEHPDRRRR